MYLAKLGSALKHVDQGQIGTEMVKIDWLHAHKCIEIQIDTVYTTNNLKTEAKYVYFNLLLSVTLSTLPIYS